MLSDTTFQTVIKNTPLVSIDLVIKDKLGRVLLGKRNNRPAQGYWFVPGGRVRKNESLYQAFKRLTDAELNEKISIDDASFLGVYEHLYEDSVFGSKVSTHYIVLGYQLTIDLDFVMLPADQHHKYDWFEINDLLDNNNVHKNTKAYFKRL
ncbi:GDP-mannose mannosyl hydrolase [Psychrobacter sp. 1U2]|uniref:GDP-mannose mannosyl hydrolase n=1 Tax=Psychrobacter sp. 1U2 TaxID=3453577 RepID=UPI003F48F28F